MKTLTKNLSIVFALATSLIAILVFTANQTNATNQIILQESNLVTNPSTNKLYILKSEGNVIFRREILDKRVLSAYSDLSINNILSVDNEIFSRFTPSNLLVEVDHRNIPVDGRIYSLSITPTTNIITKHHLNITPREFELLGLSWGGVYPISSYESSLYKEGSPMNATMVANYIILPNQKQTPYTHQQIQNYRYGYYNQTTPNQTNINHYNNTYYQQTPYPHSTQNTYQQTPYPHSTQNTYQQPLHNQTQQQNSGINSVTIHEPYGLETYSQNYNTPYTGNPYIGGISIPQTNQQQTQNTNDTTQTTNDTTQNTNDTTQTEKKETEEQRPSRISSIPRKISSKYKRENATSNNLIPRSSLLVSTNRNIPQTSYSQNKNNEENSTEETTTQTTTQTTNETTNENNEENSTEETTGTNIPELIQKEYIELVQFFLGVSQSENNN